MPEKRASGPSIASKSTCSQIVIKNKIGWWSISDKANPIAAKTAPLMLTEIAFICDLLSSRNNGFKRLSFCA